MQRALSSILVVAALSVAAHLPAQSAARAAGHPAAAVADVDTIQPGPADAGAVIGRLLTEAHDRGVFHGSALVAVGESTVYEGDHGTADAAGSIPLDPSHRFLIGSIGKEFSAAALMVLAQEGALDLADPLSRPLPWLPAWAERVRVRDLLTHTTGLPRVRYGEVETDEDVRGDLMAVEELAFEPGTGYGYNNNDIFLRKRVVEAVSGQPYGVFLRSRLLSPCGMTGALVDPDRDDPRLVQSYDGERVEDAFRSPMSGQVAVTARDLHRWTRCLHSGDVISQPSLMELTRSFDDDTQSPLGHTGTEDGALQWHWHHGQVASYEALYYVNRETGLTVVLLTNSKQNQVGSIATAIDRAVRGEAYELPKRSLELALRARILHHGFEAGTALLERIEARERERYELSDVEEDLTETGEYLLEQGRAEDAARVYRLALERLPESDAARAGLAEARRAAGEAAGEAP